MAETNEQILPGPIPKYRQLLYILRDRIQSGDLPPGLPLPTEELLSQMYGISRGTVRKAMAQLEAERLVRIEQGVGSFANSPSPTAVPFRFEDRRSWFQESEHEYTYELLSKEVIPAPMDVAERLSLSPAEHVVHIERLELVYDQVFAHTSRFFRKSLCPSILDQDLTKVSLQNCLVDLSALPLLRAEIAVEAHILSEDEAQLLRTDPGIPGIMVDRITFTAPNRPAVWYRGIFKNRFHLGAFVDPAWALYHTKD